MKNKILIITALLTLAGCRSKKATIEKTLVGAEVERIVQVEKHISEIKKEDSVKVVEKKNERKRHEKDEHTLLLRIFRKLLKIDSYETYILPFVMFLFLGVVICPENE